MGLGSSVPGLDPKVWEWGGLPGLGNILEQQPVLCLKAVQDWPSAGAINNSFGTPFGSLAPFRYSRKKIPEVGIDQERFLGRRRKAVERAFLQSEEAQQFLGAWAAAAVLCV